MRLNLIKITLIGARRSARSKEKFRKIDSEDSSSSDSEMDSSLELRDIKTRLKSSVIVSPKDGGKIYKCFFCPKIFKEMINAQRHILSRKKCLLKNEEKNVSKDDLETVIKSTPTENKIQVSELNHFENANSKTIVNRNHRKKQKKFPLTHVKNEKIQEKIIPVISMDHVESVKNFKKEDSNHPQPSKVEKNLIEYNLPFGWKKIIHRRTRGVFIGKWVDILIQSPNGKILRKKKELEKYIKDHQEIVQYDAELTNFSKPPDFPRKRKNSKHAYHDGENENNQLMMVLPEDESYTRPQNAKIIVENMKKQKVCLELTPIKRNNFCFLCDQYYVTKGDYENHMENKHFGLSITKKTKANKENDSTIKKKNTVVDDKKDDDILILPQIEYEEKNTNEILKRDIIAQVKEMFKKQRDEKLANLQRENEDLMKEHQKEILQMKKLIEKQQNLLRKVTNLEKKYENELGHLKKEVMELKEKQHAKTNECNDTLISDTVLINSSDQETLIIDHNDMATVVDPLVIDEVMIKEESME